MIYRWIGKSVDLDSLVEHVQSFFADKSFIVRTDKMTNESVVWAVKKNVKGKSYIVTVKVFGDSDDFRVEFLAGGQTRAFKMFSSAVTLFGLGMLVQRELKQIDFFEKIEEDFWVFMDEAVANLGASKRKVTENKVAT